MRVLFLCGKNRCRSPTAEVVFGRLAGIETDSAGVRDDADVVVSAEQVAWADVVAVMERRYRKPLEQRVGAAVLRHKKVVNLDVTDDYDAMDDALIALLLTRAARLGIALDDANDDANDDDTNDDNNANADDNDSDSDGGAQGHCCDSPFVGGPVCVQVDCS